MQQSEEPQDEAAILRDIIKGVDELIIETRQQLGEVRSLKREIEQKHDKGQMTDFSYAINLEHSVRAGQSVDYLLRSLDRQKKIALRKLQELG